MDKQKLKYLAALHLLLLLYSFSSILSKTAARSEDLLPFLFCYAGLLLILAFYALGWQQIIKHLPLSTAYTNKAVTIVWGMIWGSLLFQETITPGKLAGAALIIAGIFLFSRKDGEQDG